MKRDMDLIRLLLIEQETGEAPEELKQYDEKLVVHNVALMLDAGLIDGEVFPGQDGSPTGAVIIRLTWAGHDFLDSTCDPSIWEKAKEKVIKPGVSWTKKRGQCLLPAFSSCLMISCTSFRLPASVQ